MDVVQGMERVRRERQRWLCLMWLDISRPTPMTGGALLAQMQAEYPDANHLELQRHLDYLRKAALLTITEDGQSWLSQLTRQGIDFVEYTSPATPGIGRPTVV
jgi:hypothetical protein